MTVSIKPDIPALGLRVGCPLCEWLSDWIQCEGDGRTDAAMKDQFQFHLDFDHPGHRAVIS